MFRMEVARKNDSRLSLRGGKNVPGGVKKTARASRAPILFYAQRIKVIFC